MPQAFIQLMAFNPMEQQNWNERNILTETDTNLKCPLNKKVFFFAWQSLEEEW